jgi:hypothetical protein
MNNLQLKKIITQTVMPPPSNAVVMVAFRTLTTFKLEGELDAVEEKNYPDSYATIIKCCCNHYFSFLKCSVPSLYTAKP